MNDQPPMRPEPRSVYKPSDLQEFLHERGLYAKKGLSQNFLIDGNIVQKIVDTANVHAGDWVIEVGPGPGALTQAILARGAHVLAVEMDTDFAQALNRLQTSDGRLQVFCSDILKFQLVETLKEKGIKSCKVVANLPYHITTPILTLMLPLYPLIESLTIMVQKEFGDRMQAKKATPEYGSFTLFLEFYASVAKSFTVSPNCFHPRPKVHSSVVHCQLHSPRLGDQVEPFFQLTRTAFGQRRKMLRASLRDLYGAANVEKALEKIGKAPSERPEHLSLEEFIQLFHVLRAS